jgi:tRNA dimethylallyltransferase
MVPPAGRATLPPPIGVLVGPTGSGKSDLALAIARRLPVEILAADSRQVYRGMDIGTAKPDHATRAAVPHHLLDLVAPDERFTVAGWVARARVLIPQIAARGHLPLVVGGTGLYVTALIDGYRFEGGAWSSERRDALLEELARNGVAALAARLAQSDPRTAARIDLRNPRRVVRALERAATNEESPGRGQGTEPYEGAFVMLGIRRPRAALQQRIDARTAAMFRSGLLDEVRALSDAGYGPDLVPLTGHGYREAARVMEGAWPVAQAVAETALHTRQYAKRQMTWFRRDRRIVWLEAGTGPADVSPLVDKALDLLRPLAERIGERDGERVVSG